MLTLDAEIKAEVKSDDASIVLKPKQEVVTKSSMNRMESLFFVTMLFPWCSFLSIKRFTGLFHPATELPCTVKLRIWSHDLKDPCALLKAERCRLVIPHDVLCRANRNKKELYKSRI
ncbi:hypothetical protein L1987_85718 [Smallanthus sonchifolius]|uniref:Uncharacterized protein n=1 Tax=Smallanthus sonchifolius TaxID=185202 RepID=A0ACB8XWN1_9ASTR|nr:hypothetical protein L1987_85718 [Smallanthus sonchifolius]